MMTIYILQYFDSISLPPGQPNDVTNASPAISNLWLKSNHKSGIAPAMCHRSIHLYMGSMAKGGRWVPRLHSGGTWHLLPLSVNQSISFL